MHRRDCSRPLTLYGPQAAHSSPLLPASCDIPLNSAAHVCLAWKVIQSKPEPWGPGPKAWAAEAHLSPEKEGRVFRPSNCVRLFLSQLGGAHCQLLWVPGGGHVRFMGCPWAPGPSWPGSPLMELICDLLISPEQIRL